MWRQMLLELIEALDIRTDVVTREDAARELLARPVSFEWRPVIVEEKR